MKRVKSKICLFLTIALIFSVFSVFNFHTLKAESTAKAELLKLDLTKQDGMNLEYVVQVTQPVEADALTISNINLIYKDEQDHFISVSLSLMMNVPGNQLEDKGNGVYRVKTSSLQYGETTGTYTLNSVKLVLSNNTTVVDYKSSWEHTIAVTKNPLSAPVITSVNMEGNKIGAIALPYEKDIHFTVENAEQYDKVTYSLNYKSKNNNHDTFISQDKYNPTNTFYFDELIRFSDNEWSLKSIEVRAANYEQNAFKTTIYTNDNNDDNSDIEIKPLSDLPFNPSIFDFTVTNYLSDKEPPVLNSFKVLTTDVTLPAKAKISIDMSDNSGTMNYQPMMQAKVTRNGETKVESVSFVSNKRVEGTNEIVGYVQIGNGGRYSGLEKAEIIEVTLNDTAGNRVTYTSDQTKIDEYAKNPNPNNPIKSMPKVDPISFKELYKFDKKLNVDSGEYINIVKNMQEGSYVLLDISNKQIIDKDFFDAIKGKNITVVFQTFNSMALQWVVNGKDINEQTKDIDMSIKQIAVNDKVKEGEDSTLDLFNMNKGKTQEEKNNTTLKYIKMEYYKEYLKQFDIKTANYADEFIKEYLKHNRYKLVFAENGTLPGKMRIRVSSEDVNSQIPSDEISDNMSVYYQVSENEYQLIDSNLVSEADGSYAFDIYHNSTYVMTTNNLSPAIVKKIVTFKDGDTTTTKEVVQGEKVSEPATPTKQGYTFDGWYLNNQKFDFNTVISEDITLVAKWTKVKEEVIDDTKVDVIVPSIDTTHDKEEVVIGVSDKEEVKQVISDSVSKETKEVIVNAIKNGKQVATNVRAEKIDLTKVSEVVKEEVKQIQSFVAKKNMKVVDYLDLSVFVEVDGQVIEQLTQTNKPLTFQIALPDQLMKEGRTFYVIRLHDGKSEVLETTLTNGVLSFTTDKFSTYALVYEDVEKTTPADQINDKKVETGDSSHTNELWLLLGFALVVISGLTLKRKIVK